jgi:hypothetical protein
MIPVLYPTGVQEIIELGVHGFAMSRYSGCYVAFKTVSETVDTSASIDIDPHAVETVLPTDFQMPEGGVNLRWPDAPMEQELRLQQRQGVRGPRLCAREPVESHHDRFAAPAPRDHRLGQELPRTCCRRSRTWASTRGTRPISASASSRSACPGR